MREGSDHRRDAAMRPWSGRASCQSCAGSVAAEDVCDDLREPGFGDVKNVPSVGAHRLLDGGGGLSVGNRQIHDKLLRQVLHFPGTDADVLSRRFIADFLTAAVTQKE